MAWPGAIPEMFLTDLEDEVARWMEEAKNEEEEEEDS